MLYRAEQGQISRRRAAVAAFAVVAASDAAGAWHTLKLGGTPLQQREWVITVALAGLTFAVGMKLRSLPGSSRSCLPAAP